MENFSQEASYCLPLFVELCGWTYFTAWTISFYPQLIMNYQTKSTVGLSGSFACFNLIGFMALAVFDIIRYKVQLKYELASAVKEQDLCFAIHAVILCAACCAQVAYYKSWTIVQKSDLYLMAGVTLIIGATLFHIFAVWEEWIPLTTYPDLDTHKFKLSAWTFTEFCAAIKLGITVSKYLPQILLNRTRQETSGLAIWTFNLDCIGGIFSLLQNVVEAIGRNSMAYITGNIPKIGIGVIGLTYNAIILSQHYLLYNDQNENRTQKQLNDEVNAGLLSMIVPAEQP